MSDMQLQRGVSEFLKYRHIAGVRSFEVEAHGGTVVLRGVVSSDYAKWSCYECCRHVTGVMHVVDQIVVSS